MWSYGCTVGLLWKYEYNAKLSIPSWIFNIYFFIHFWKNAFEVFHNIEIGIIVPLHKWTYLFHGIRKIISAIMILKYINSINRPGDVKVNAGLEDLY